MRCDANLIDATFVCIDPVMHLGDILTVLSLLTAVLIGGFTVMGILDSLKKSRAEQRSAHYSELDNFYGEILRTGIEYPHLRTPTPLISDEAVLLNDYAPFPADDPDLSSKCAQYDAYAFMIWNFLETIHDRCQEDPDLKATWAPVLHAENALHRGWFLQQMRREHLKQTELGAAYRSEHKFCEGFRIFVFENQSYDDDWTYRKTFKAAPDFRFGAPPE